MDKRIKVIDSFTSSGKTSWAINYINQLDEDTKVIFITPFLSECNRIIEHTSRKFIQPDVKIGKGRKMDHLVQLVSKGENIVSTHALFSNIDDTLINALRSNDYVLFLDETMNVVENFDLYKESKLGEEKKLVSTKNDILSLTASGYIHINDDYSVSWSESDYLVKYGGLKCLADRNLLYFINDSLLIWTFPIEVFRPGIFSEIYIMTYLFDYQMQALYYNYFDLEYDIFHIETIDNQYALVATSNNQEELDWKKKVSPLIHIIDASKINRIGSVFYDSLNRPVKTSLSKTWYEKNPELVEKMRDNLVNFFKNHTEAKSNQRLWTCFKDDINKLRSRSLSKLQWLEITSRATNDYGDRTALAYCVNRYPNPFFQHFFSKRNIQINEDHYALSEMLQWIWRSAIRNYQPVDLYIPSERMRTLLLKWLHNEEVVF
jgi:hypothetical protein